MKQGTLFILSGPSGVGKNAVERQLRKLLPNLEEITTYTTRSPRPNEQNGIDYHFVTRTTFQEMIDQKAFLEWAVVHDQLYGTPKEAIEKQTDTGKDILLIIDVQGALAIKKELPETKLIFLEPESEDQLLSHLKKRKSIQKADLELRLENAKKELAMRDLYDYRVVNKEGQIKQTAQEIAEIMAKA